MYQIEAFGPWFQSLENICTLHPGMWFRYLVLVLGWLPLAAYITCWKTRVFSLADSMYQYRWKTGVSFVWLSWFFPESEVILQMLLYEFVHVLV